MDGVFKRTKNGNVMRVILGVLVWSVFPKTLATQSTHIAVETLYALYLAAKSLPIRAHSTPTSMLFF